MDNKKTFCDGRLYKDISNILINNLFDEKLEIERVYENFKKVYNNSSLKTNENSIIEIKDLTGYKKLLADKTNIENLGIDLPIYFGNPNNNNRIMIVAMDPKRIGQSNNKISIGTVFALHQKETRITKKNDYWKFIEPLTKENFVYLTDIYKLYYESFEIINGKQTKILSNKDTEYISPKCDSFETNKKILEEEIKLIKPKTIISLGNESANALKKISGINSTELEVFHNGIKYVFMPHISRTVTQNILTISNLFISMGKLKNNKKMIEIGEQIKINKLKLFE
jgi:uracil-DNA glycosylase